MANFELMTLPYASNALAPVMSSETVDLHYGKHLATYVNNLNALLPGSGLVNLSLEDIVVKAEGALANNAGQVLNHELFFGQFQQPREENAPVGELMEAIGEEFGSFAVFKEEFEKMGTTLFGSGWVWLSSADNGALRITQEKDAANPVQRGLRPLLTFDVWEHAYYLDYQNRRAEYLKTLWQIVDWEVVEQRYLRG